MKKLKGRGVCPRSQSQEVAAAGFQPKLSACDWSILSTAVIIITISIGLIITIPHSHCYYYYYCHYYCYYYCF